MRRSSRWSWRSCSPSCSASSACASSGIAFAMVTLAFAQAGAVLALKDPHHWTHGEEGLGADYTKLPQAFVGILNTKNLYWLALALPRRRLLHRPLGVESSPDASGRRSARTSSASRCSGCARARTSCRRSSSRRRSRPPAASSTCSSTAARRSRSTAPNFTLTLLLMVVIGGAGSRWGAVLGGILYTYLDDRLVAIGVVRSGGAAARRSARRSSSRCSCSASIFILIVVFLPGGLARHRPPRQAATRAPARRRRGR